MSRKETDGQPARPVDRSTRAPDDRETALAARWRRLREGVPPALYLLACAVVLAVALVGIGWVLAKVVHDDGIGRADAGVSRWLAGERTPDLNDATVYTSEVGGTLTVTALAVLAVAFAALAWRRWREPMLVAVAVAGEVAIFLVVTMLVDRERPPVRHLDEAPPTSSFPSGHTAATIALWGSLAVLANERARSAVVRNLFLVLAFVVPLLVASSRMYRGMHFLTDVLGGMLLGGLWLLATVQRHPPRGGPLGHPPRRGRDRRTAVATIGGAPWLGRPGWRSSSTRPPAAARRPTASATPWRPWRGPAWRCCGWRRPRRTPGRARPPRPSPRASSWSWPRGATAR